MARTPFVGVAVLAVMVAGMPSTVSAQGQELMVGTWELNVSKSRMTPGALPKSQTRTYELTGKQMKSVQRGIDADGKPTLVQIAPNYDGKDYPVVGSPVYDTIALNPIDSHTASVVQKKDGKVVFTGQRVITHDFDNPLPPSLGMFDAIVSSFGEVRIHLFGLKWAAPPYLALYRFDYFPIDQFCFGHAIGYLVTTVLLQSNV